MEDFDPTEPLLDFYAKYTKPGIAEVYVRPEEPALGCPCQDDDNEGRFSGSWVFSREPQCTCGEGSYDDLTVLHDAGCDSVPCPLCALEAKRG